MSALFITSVIKMVGFVVFSYFHESYVSTMLHMEEMTAAVAAFVMLLDNAGSREGCVTSEVPWKKIAFFTFNTLKLLMIFLTKGTFLIKKYVTEKEKRVMFCPRKSKNKIWRKRLRFDRQDKK